MADMETELAEAQHQRELSTRNEVRDRRASHGDHATCPTCLMTVLVDPRVHPGRLVEHTLRNGAVCRSSDWWRCPQCMDYLPSGCTVCDGWGWTSPFNGATEDGTR